MLNAARIARDLATGRLRAEQVLDDATRALAAREPEIRAFTLSDVPAARAALSRHPGPLSGLPFAAKDNFDTQAFITAYGSPIYAGHRPVADAAAVTMATAAGAVLIGKTALAEFAVMAGPATRNPHDLARTPGGSSSGSAAAVAAGMAAFAFGTQTAGSVIRPAAFCGVAGYKPTFGRLPMAGVKLVAPSLDTVGLFAATIADVAFVAAGLTGEASMPAEGRTDWRIGICPAWAGLRADDAMQAALARATRAAAAAGATVTPVVLPPAVETADAAHPTIMGYEAARALADEYAQHRPALSPRLSTFLEAGGRVTDGAYGQALTTAATARAAVGDLFDTVDILLAPGAPGPAPEGLAETGSPLFNRLWTLLHLPVVAIPGLKTETGLPLGVQAIGPAGADGTTLGAAEFLEGAIARHAE